MKNRTLHWSGYSALERSSVLLGRRGICLLLARRRRRWRRRGGGGGILLNLMADSFREVDKFAVVFKALPVFDRIIAQLVVKEFTLATLVTTFLAFFLPLKTNFRMGVTTALSLSSKFTTIFEEEGASFGITSGSIVLG